MGLQAAREVPVQGVPPRLRADGLEQSRGKAGPDYRLIGRRTDLLIAAQVGLLCPPTGARSAAGPADP
jgi:hypothetical protein